MPAGGKRYGSSCLICRRRKVRCEGTRPKCNNCVKSRDHCVYSANDATVTRLQNAWTDCQARLRDLEQQLSNAARLEPGKCLEEIQRLVAELRSSSPKLQSDKQAEDTEILRRDRLEQDAALPNQGQAPSSSEHQADASMREEEYIATSKFYDQGDTPSADIADSADQTEYHKRWLASNTRFHSAYEDLAYAKIDKDQRVDPSLAKKLLDIYWTWQGPLHNYVYRPSFFRDMALNGPYFSDFLLFVIYSHAARHVSPTDPSYSTLEHGEPLLERARLLLLDEIKRERPVISTIQGLLMLGGRQCAIGKNSEGWLYTGMAIAMIKDRGFHLSHRFSKKTTEPDDYETQKRLYLSAFVWDKTISLCLGRPPSLTSMPYPDHCLYDKSDDAILWHPVHLGQLTTPYLPTPCYNSSTFSHFVRLSTIVNDAFRTVFGPKARTASVETLRAVEHRLYQFSDSLPAALRMSESTGDMACPPPHICCLNILFHTILILIYRPFLIDRGAYTDKEPALFQHAAMICTREAATVNKFFQAYGRCFENKNQTYLLSYCVYTAATIDVHLAGDRDYSVSTAAKARLVTTLRMLDGQAKQTPGVRRSIDIIKSSLGQLDSHSLQPRVYQGTALASSDHHRSVGVFTGPEVAENHDATLSPTRAILHPDLHQQTIQTNIPELPQWLGDVNQMFSTWGAATINVGGGFVPDTPGWYSSFQY